MKIIFASLFKSGNLIVTLENGETLFDNSISEMTKKLAARGVDNVNKNMAGMGVADWDELFTGPLKTV